MARPKPASLVILAVSILLLASVVAHRYIWPPSYPTGAEILRELHREGFGVSRLPPPHPATVTTRERRQS